MRRRELLTGLAGAIVASAVRARAAGKTYRLAVMSGSQPTSEMSETGFYRTLFKELRRLGYIEGENLVVSRFSAGGDAARYDSVIEQVISAAPDIVFTANNPVVLRFKALMTSTPIVALMGDPVAWGIVTSLAHPGGNITGISADAGEEIWAKGSQYWLSRSRLLRASGFCVRRRFGIALKAPWSARQLANRR
jgi:putative tryptophan/tyrosine transport system substrate-binding protein